MPKLPCSLSQVRLPSVPQPSAPLPGLLAQGKPRPEPVVAKEAGRDLAEAGCFLWSELRDGIWT